MHAAAERIIPVNLELGGKSPVIVFTDADLDAAVGGGVLRGFLVNAGQTCNACTRPRGGAVDPGGLRGTAGRKA